MRFFKWSDTNNSPIDILTGEIAVELTGVVGVIPAL